MTNQSPIIPPIGLVARWVGDYSTEEGHPGMAEYIANRTAQWFRDQVKADIKRERQEVADEDQRRFLAWWQNEGSAMRPLAEEDTEEYMRRMTEIAWLNGAYCARYPF